MSDIDRTTNLELSESRQAGSKRPFLVVLHGETTGLTLRLDADQTIIGRGTQANIVLKDDLASREHAVIKRRVAEDGSAQYYINDLASTNGTFLNDVRIASQHLLQQGDRIKIGNHLLKFVSLSDLEAESLEPPHPPSSAERQRAAETVRPALYFDSFHLPHNVDLLYNGEEVVPLEPRAVQVLRYLAQNHERVVPKEELLDTIWPDVFTTDGVLKRAISQVRRALGDDADEARFIETYHRRGYRFIAPVRRHH
jgi:DNA-binding winged helix-turn-helix (wHTH) protein/pSer/pThr/pTyr-binding forkhead associated (FHA) protein